MFRKGNYLDNAVTENFFGTLRLELFYLKEYESTDQLKKDMKDYICYYNKKPNKTKLKWNRYSIDLIITNLIIKFV